MNSIRVRIKHGSVLAGKTVYGVGDTMETTAQALEAMDPAGVMFEVLDSAPAPAPVAAATTTLAPATEAPDTTTAPKRRRKV